MKTSSLAGARRSHRAAQSRLAGIRYPVGAAVRALQLGAREQFGEFCVVAGGMLERFPRLKFAFMEAGCGWVPYWMERLDEHYEILQPTVPYLTKPPSEYMKSGQMFYAFEMEEKMLPYVADFVGADRLVFATDYNHTDSKFPHTVDEVLKRKDLSEPLKTKIMGANASKLYSL